MTQAVDDLVYREDARSYRSIAWSLLVIPVAVAADLLVSGRHGALVHLPGWVLFGGILVGIQWLALHAVRSTHSLTVTADQLAVGDESLPRAEIAGVTLGRPVDPGLDTLGWPNGFPRTTSSVTIRLADGRDVLVPTRFPDRLRDALRVGAPEPERLPDVRVAGPADLPVLADIDDRADAIFTVAGYRLAPDRSRGSTGEALLVLVVDDPPVGFARVEQLDGQAYLAALAVLPRAMRRGHGSRLLEAACRWAAEQGYESISLTAFADIAWNGPFCVARGFVEDSDPGPGLRAVRAHERQIGLDDVAPRVVLNRALSSATPTR